MSILKVKNGNNWDEIPSIKGKSAYQYAVDGGYQGTEQEFAQKMAQEYVKPTDYATSSDAGVVKVDSTNGIGIESGHKLYVEYAPSNLIKSGTGNYRPITPPRQHEAAFYGLAKAAGDSTQAASSNAVGTYTADAKAAIQSMLGTPNKAIIAAEYDATATYALGDVCLHEGQLYECSTAISTAEAWTAAHWTAKTVADELSDLKGGLTDIQTVLELDASAFVFVSSTDDMTDQSKVYVLTTNNHIYRSQSALTPVDEFEIDDLNWRIYKNSPYGSEQNGYFSTALIPFTKADKSATFTLKNAKNLSDRYGSSYYGQSRIVFYDSTETPVMAVYIANSTSDNYMYLPPSGNDLVGTLGGNQECLDDFEVVEDSVAYVAFCWCTSSTPKNTLPDADLPAIIQSDVTAKNYGIFISTHSQTSFEFVDTGEVYDPNNNAIDKIKSDINAIESEISDVENLVENSVIVDQISANSIEWENKSITASNGSASDNTARLKTKNPIPKTITCVKTSSATYTFALFGYQLDGTYVGWWDGARWRKDTIYWANGSVELNDEAIANNYNIYIVARNISNTALTINDIKNYIYLYSINRYIASSVEACFPSFEIRNGNSESTSESTAVAVNNIIDVSGASSVAIVINKPLSASTNHYSVGIITYTTGIGYRVSESSGMSARIGSNVTALQAGENSLTVELGQTDEIKGISFVLYEFTSNDVAVPLRAYDFSANGITIIRNYATQRGASNNYYLDSGFVKHPVSIMALGNLKYTQSFLIYNDKYYSISGSKIAVQNASFQTQTDTSLALGHGNSFQLGNNGKAYASGWDDNKIYVVDLETLTIDDTISLPTTGYTTGVVDDVNKVMYIFQRDTSPSTEEAYNFIVYDYDGGTVVQTKKLPIKFGAMQACDFYRGRIVVLYGNGSTLQNGYVVFDTEGNILGEYIINDKSTDEPEGVFIDRETFDVYLSYISEHVYKITQ